MTLTPRAYDVLALLLKNNGTVVEKSELFDRIWKDTYVTDNALSKVIKELRHAFADSADEPRYIETIPKRGYRFIGKLQTEPAVSNDHESGRKQAASKSTGSRSIRPQFLSTKVALSLVAFVLIVVVAGWFLSRRFTERLGSPTTIAVLPFKPLNTESRDESLEMGMAETLINRLSNLSEIVVRPMSSVRRFNSPDQDPLKAGQEVNAEAVLDGSIQKSGDRIRITVRLTDIRTETVLWTERFDENFTDIFRVQDSIAERITNALALKLSKQEQELLAKHHTENPEAFEAYLRGQFLWNRRGPDWIKQSLGSYKLAVEKDPNFALAHIGVADSYIMLSGHRMIAMQEAEASAEPSIVKALEIDNGLAQAHNALAELRYQYKYDWIGAEREFRTAIDLNPNVAWIRQAYGWFLMSDGRFEEAAVEMEKARQLDPSSLTINVGRGRLYYYTRQYDKAIQHFQNLIASEPNDPSLYISLYSIYEQNRMYSEAFATFLKMGSILGRQQTELDEFRSAFNSGGWQGFHQKKLKDADHASVRTGRSSPSRYAEIYIRLGDKEKAFYWVEKMFEERDAKMLQFKIEPAYDILRDDPRYAKLLQKINQQP